MERESKMKKKASKKKSPAKEKVSALKKASAPAHAMKQHVVNKQPQSKQQAAIAHGMFLYTDDAWSLRYFDQTDLHCKEREVFG
jgi:hypothetical protein